MSRHSEIVTAGTRSIETYVDGAGPAVVIIPSYGRDGGDDFEPFTNTLVGAGYRVLRPQPRGIGKSTGPMAPSPPTTQKKSPQSSSPRRPGEPFHPKSTAPQCAPAI
jgi:pimeloyl-ACP methyl ester carboxylesterase